MGRPKDADAAPRRIEGAPWCLWADHTAALAAAERLRGVLPAHPVPDFERQMPSASPVLIKALRQIVETA